MIQLLNTHMLFIRNLFFIFCLSLLTAEHGFAQGIFGGNLMSCPMCNNMGWGGLAFGVVMIIAMITAFIALVFFLVRRGRSSP